MVSAPAIQATAAFADQYVIDLDREFTLFPQLPIELRVKIWEQAFPARVVNLLYDQYKERFHSFNSSVPKLLHVNRESREMGLKLYHLCFGTESFAPRIYFDFNKDILLFDDYLHYRPGLVIASDEIHYKEPPEYASYPIKPQEQREIQRIAVNNMSYKTASDDLKEGVREGTGLQQFTESLMTKFPALRELSVVIEMVNPYSVGPIRFFDIGTKKCDLTCELCYTAQGYRNSIESLRVVHGQKLVAKLVGGYRGASRFDLGCYDGVMAYDDLDDKPDVHDSEYIEDASYAADEGLEADKPYSYDSDDGDEEIKLGEYLCKDAFEKFEYEDVEIGFSDWGDDVAEAQVSEQEINDITVDEMRYQEKAGRGHYVEMQDHWVEAEYYNVRMIF